MRGAPPPSAARAFRFAQEAFGCFPRRPKLAAKKTAAPPSIIGFERRLGIAYLRRKLADAREGGIRFLGDVALGPHDGLAVAGLQFQALRAASGVGFHYLVHRERLEQRLRLGDLRKLRRRRKTFQRRPQNVVGVGRAAGGLIELGQRQRGAQLEAAGLLLLRDGDGGEEGGFGGGGVGGVLFEEDFAADAMESGVEPMLSGLARQRQRSVDPGQGGFRASPLGFDFREQPLK